jgi:hypothetical protein
MDDKDREALEWLEVTAEWASREGGEHAEHAHRILALAKRALRMEVVGYIPADRYGIRWSLGHHTKAAVVDMARGVRTNRILTLYAEAPDE